MIKANKSQHVLSCGIIPVRQNEDSWLFLVLRAYAYWDFPKGIAAPGEDGWVAALRELQEETGLVDVQPQWGKDFYETPVYSRNKVARYYLALVRQTQVFIRPNAQGQREHHEYRWMTYDQAHEHFVARLRAVLSWAHGRLSKS